MKEIKVKIVNKSKNDIPKYESLTASGLDVRCDLELQDKGVIIDDNNNLTLMLLPGERIMVHTGIYVAIPEGYEIQVRPRSGLAIKKGLGVLNSPGTIDADYRGECNVILINHHTDLIVIEDGERIAQFVLNEVPRIEWSIVNELDSTERGAGGFGHTGTK